MTWEHLQAMTALYLAGLLWLHHKQWILLRYIWSAFGFAFILINLSLLQNWHAALASIEAGHVQAMVAPLGIALQVQGGNLLLVPDPTGWSGLQINIECSTLIELSVLVGLLLFYPRLPFRRRWLYLGLGSGGTYLLNLLRILVIVVLIHTWGKPVVYLAHVIIGRLVYFAGVVALYWFLLTRPTLALVHRSIETTGRAVQ